MFENQVFGPTTQEGTDLELARRVATILCQCHMAALRRIHVVACNGTVTLQGKVQSFYERQICLSCCQRVEGVLRLVDEIEVAA